MAEIVVSPLVAMVSLTMGEGTGHQLSVIPRQPGVPPKRRLLWTTALVARSIGGPFPHCAGGRGGLPAALGSIDGRPQLAVRDDRGDERGGGSSVDVLDVLITMCGSDFPMLPVQANGRNSRQAELQI